MNGIEFFARQQRAIKASPDRNLSNRNKKTRLILLACQLLAPKLGLKGQKTALSMTTASLTKQIQEEGESSTLEGAKKMAQRDMQHIKNIFGLDGNETTGYQLATNFELPRAYLKMFNYWLCCLNQKQQSSDTVLKVMLEGLIHAIESAFTDDPICIPALAKALKAKYEKSNSRDTSRPLKQLFDDRAMIHFLPLENISEEPDTYKVDLKLEPLLMRKQSRERVGSNEDDTLILARPGLIRSCIYGILKHEHETRSQHIMRLAEAVQHMELWQHQEKGACIPYALHLNRKTDEYVLVIYWQDSGSYQDYPAAEISNIPSTADMMYYCPEGFSIELWKQWKVLSYWQL
ncbi:MAG: hypothetical protein Q9M11_03490 [Mariprofundaceae bacterium]|nr:hypothetical protein [Mariprofundaceae bacterium]